jgi:para-aminobenzoate synthetase
VFADRAVVIDHDAGCCYAMCWSPIPGDAHSARWLRLTGDLLTRLEPATASPVAAPITVQPDAVTMRHRCHPRRYRKLIGRCLDLIRAGETYDVCLTNTMTVEGTVAAAPSDAAGDRGCPSMIARNARPWLSRPSWTRPARLELGADVG